ncbi:MAG: tRNA (adenosine(37)-N6)-dimethylallyltransferase MiaA [Cellvibrionales bacterium]|nr:tRNA (adenosine(37)-N6)-dimethylallyltransferase MiaA [Cellvibrionales bacterium]
MNLPLLCVMGPTAAGKTAFAIELAESLGGELISVDSALVYRGLAIGAAQPDYPHHLIDIRDPSEPYSAAEFARDAAEAIADIRARGRLPILVGGTLLYFRALLQGFDAIPATRPEVRVDIEEEAARSGWPALHAKLAEVDPVLAARLHPNHSQRIGRGLEVWRMTGRPLSSWQEGNLSPAVDGEAIPLVIAPRSREELHGRIARRFDDMLSEGFLEEVEALYRRGDLTPDLPAIRAVGYRQMWRYVAGETNLETAREAGIAATRQLAKRQLTGLRRWPDALWLLTGPDLQLSEVKTASEGRLLALARTIDTTLIKGEQVFSRPSHSFSRQIGEILRNLVANGNN